MHSGVLPYMTWLIYIGIAYAALALFAFAAFKVGGDSGDPDGA